MHLLIWPGTVVYFFTTQIKTSELKQNKTIQKQNSVLINLKQKQERVKRSFPQHSL